ncbi:hypothetical protein LCGC14_0447870 [marine sediment metagenome]|uniref:Uncharacterized protein n=1 Tax=marine sediment metagenome TaxID=412755 RepID=A0A0F9T1Y1_9ZZZZ
MANSLFEYHVSGTTYIAEVSRYVGPPLVYIYCGMTFTPQENYTLNAIRTRLKRSGSPGTIYFDIYATAGGLPTGSSLSQVSRNGNALTTSSTGAIYQTTLTTPVDLTSGIEYAIVLSTPNADVNNSVFWFGDITDDYANGDACVYYENVAAWGGDWTGVSDGWTALPDTQRNWVGWNIQDFDFQTWGVGAAPTKPTNPTPANSATGVDFSGLVLDWDDGGGADTFDVYIGPSGSLVKVADAIVPSTYTVTIGDVPTEQVIYWRVDATNAGGTTTGDIWNFDARPVKATTPSPADATSSITLDETPLSWVDGGNSDTYDVYFRIQGNDWVEESSAQAAIEWAIAFGTLDYSITYEWKIESTNIFGTTTGDTWSFGIIDFDQIRVSYRLISGGNGSGPYDSPPGVRGTDWEYTGESGMITVRKLIAAANNTIWYESI